MNIGFIIIKIYVKYFIYECVLYIYEFKKIVKNTLELKNRNNE